MKEIEELQDRVELLESLDKEIEKLQARVELLENLIRDEIYQKEYFGPLMRCRFCQTVKGNGHGVDCRIGLILMDIQHIPEKEDCVGGQEKKEAEETEEIPTL